MIYEITDKKDWNDFAASCRPNTFLHSWEWGQVQKQTGEGVQYLGVFSPPYEGGVASQGRGGYTDPYPSALVAIALVITVNARRGRHYLIPHGPLFQNSLPLIRGGGMEGVDSYLAELITYLREQAKKDRVTAVRIAPLIETSVESEQIFKNLGFHPAPLHMHAELTWVLNIRPSEEQLLAGMRKTTRHAILKAQKSGVTTEVITDPEEALERFWPLYEQTRQRHGFVVWPKKMIQAQLDIFSQANSIFSVIARHNTKDVAAAILPHFSHTVYYYHGASTKLPSSIPAAQLLQWAAIKEAKRRGATRYNFWGVSPQDKPDHPFAGITTFKKGFGGQEIDYLRAQDLPLSLGYWPLWAVDTYRKFRRGF